MVRQLITYGFITGVFLSAASPLNCAENNSTPLVNPAAAAPSSASAAPLLKPPLASELAHDAAAPAASSDSDNKTAEAEQNTVKADATTASDPQQGVSAIEHQLLQNKATNTLYSEKKLHHLSEQELKKFHDLYLSSVPDKSDVIRPILQQLMGDKYALFEANYRVQSPMVWSGEVLSGWGMLPHSGGSSRVQFFIHRNGKVLVVATVEDQRFIFGAQSLFNNSYIAHELALSEND